MVASWPVVMLFAILTAASGFLFGIARGLLTTMVGAMLGAVSVFLLCRFVFRARVEKYLETNAFFLRFNGRIEREGWKLALVMRLASVPFGLVNMFMAVTRLSLFHFFITTLIGETPIAFIGCFIGSSLGSLSDITGGGGEKWTPQRIIIFSIEACLAVSFFVIGIVLSRRMIKESMDEANNPLPVPETAEEENELSGTYSIDPIEVLQSPESRRSAELQALTSSVEPANNNSNNNGHNNNRDEEKAKARSSSSPPLEPRVDFGDL